MLLSELNERPVKNSHISLQNWLQKSSVRSNFLDAFIDFGIASCRLGV
jgi:hypothetical protein